MVNLLHAFGIIMEIIETETIEKSWTKQSEAHIALAELREDQGYEIVYSSGVVICIGVNMDTYERIYHNIPDGTPGIIPLSGDVADHSAQVTWAYAIPKETPDNTFEIISPTEVDPEYSGEQGKDYGMYERPVEWDDPDYSSDTLTARFDKTEFK